MEARDKGETSFMEAMWDKGLALSLLAGGAVIARSVLVNIAVPTFPLVVLELQRLRLRHLH